MARWQRRLLLVGVWLLPALVATLGFRVVPSRYNPELGTLGIFAAQAMIWLAWGGWSLLIVAVADRVPLERGRWWRAVLVHLPVCAAVVSAQLVVIHVVSSLFSLTPRASRIGGIVIGRGVESVAGIDSMLALGLRQYGDLLVVVYCAVVGAHAALRWHQRWREESLRGAQLDHDLAEAHLQALRAQLQPHFLFNALNAVVTLVDVDPAAAKQMTVNVAQLLRASLAAGDAQETTLAQELALTARYLEIESVRFADRLTVVWDIAPDLEAVLVPTFALQPLVENALRHGIARRPGPGTVTISAALDGAALRLTVSDDGPGPVTDHRDAAPAAPTDGAGIALVNLRARVTRLYGSTATVTLHAGSTRGTDAVVRIPTRRHTATA